MKLRINWRISPLTKHWKSKVDRMIALLGFQKGGKSGLHRAVVLGNAQEGHKELGQEISQEIRVILRTVQQRAVSPTSSEGIFVPDEARRNE